jgi:hypothetical protein
MDVSYCSIFYTHMSVLCLVYIRYQLSIVLSSHNTFDTDWAWHVQMEEAENAGRLQVRP